MSIRDWFTKQEPEQEPDPEQEPSRLALVVNYLARALQAEGIADVVEDPEGATFVIVVEHGNQEIRYTLVVKKETLSTATLN